MDGGKETILVLHHTYFHDTFRDYPNSTIKRFKELKTNYFIARFIIEKKTDNEKCDPAITSNKAYGEFTQKFEESTKTMGAVKFLKILDRLIFKVTSSQIDNLDTNEGIITIADKLFSISSEYEPILVISESAKEKFVKQAEEFYKATLKEKFNYIPFRILDFEETEAFLRDKYSTLCKMVDDRTTGIF